jgi:hypothetical protein
MTSKTLISETQLLADINSALARVWQYKGFHCLVSKLRRSHRPDGNWEVDIKHSGGMNFSRSDECSTRIHEVTAQFATTHEVDWAQSAPED